MDLLNPGDNIKASDLNKGIKAKQQLGTVKTGPNMISKNFPGGIFLDARVPPPVSVPVKVVSSIATGGKYSGYIQVGVATDLDLTGFMDAPQTCLILNGPEQGEANTSPIIQSVIVVPGLIIGTDSASGNTIVLISAYSDQVCSST